MRFYICDSASKVGGEAAQKFFFFSGVRAKEISGVDSKQWEEKVFLLLAIAALQPCLAWASGINHGTKEPKCPYLTAARAKWPTEKEEEEEA